MESFAYRRKMTTFEECMEEHNISADKMVSFSIQGGFVDLQMGFAYLCKQVTLFELLEEADRNFKLRLYL